MSKNKMSTLEIPLTEEVEETIKTVIKRKKLSSYDQFVDRAFAVYDMLTEYEAKKDWKIILRRPQHDDTEIRI